MDFWRDAFRFGTPAPAIRSLLSCAGPIFEEIPGVRRDGPLVFRCGSHRAVIGPPPWPSTDRAPRVPMVDAAPTETRSSGPGVTARLPLTTPAGWSRRRAVSSLLVR